MAFDYEYFVIGAGSGGVRSSRIASAHGAKVAIAEEYRVGGTCVVRGCVPKKLLVIGAHFAEDLEDAERYGWKIEGKSFNWPTLRDNVLADVDRLTAAYQSTLDSHKVETILGRATLAGPNRVRVDDREVTARHILVATGARPQVPDIPGAELGITSNEIFHLESLPKRAIICGAGYIANEFAGILNELGVEVTLVVRSDTLLRGWDRSLADRLMAISTEKGIQFRFNTQPEKLEKQADGSLLMHCKGGKALETDLLLWAVGRVPNSAGLGLEELGVELADNGAIPVDAASHTALPWLHAVGDVTDRLQLTPIAIREGHALADKLFGSKEWTVDHDCVPSAVFSHPPLASVGLTEAQARNQHGNVKIFTSDFRPMKSVLAGRNERCLYKLVVDGATDRLLGAHMIGPDSPEILQALAIAVKAGLTKAQVDQTVALHPSMAEELVLMR
ncbi:glutathione-disulfide reductase [Sandaracinobacter sp. RS1-74]|uniref:glutathione-disulfide reductase n=1 Tax=Sandaracinobacteroides sayramensis TaxID=2913411 RepID=UPI001EDC30D7|nr:glutathione-disulfide reductase [Sandaracinobacteroides sayramensis]MCG2841497.1 glutathione-disulfide reductase [Sandaracinobacteroides sayramensis]